jgi:hypothetical protein
LRLALGVLLLLLAGVGCNGQDGDAQTDEPLPQSTSTSTSTTAPPRLAAVEPYTPLAGEPVPELKILAANALQAVGTYEAGGGSAASALRRVGSDVDAALMQSVSQLLIPDAASSIEIIYPQLGGLTEEAASIMVVYRWRTLIGGNETQQTRTADVRLARSAEGWRATTVASLGGDPAAGTVPTPTPSATAVLENNQIELADSARWDIEAGRIGDPVLDAMLSLAREHSLAVTVLATGHPHEVFETPSVSNHTEGRGVDIWAVDGVPVVAQRTEGSVIAGMVEELLDAGVTEIGSPWDLDGAGGASFTNLVHQDHLHLAFDG